MNKFLKKSLLIPVLSFLIVLSTIGIVKAWTVPVSQHSASPVALVDEDGQSIGTTNPIPVSSSPPSITTITDGAVDVAVGATAKQLSATSVPFNRCVFQAKEGNVDILVFGSSTVVPALATRTGIALLPFASLTVENGDLSSFYINSNSAGDGITYYCES